VEKLIKQIPFILAGAVFIYLGALIAFDIKFTETKIPITGQSFAVLVVGYLLGKSWGMRAVAIYLLIGILGLPVFAKGASGFETLKGGSGGFLYGFLFAAYFIGWLREIGWRENFFKILAAMTFGTIVILAFGIGQLSYLYGFEKGMGYGFYPYWEGAIIKIFLGAIFVFIFERFLPLQVSNLDSPLKSRVIRFE